MSITAKLNPRHQQLIRDKINAALLIEKLQQCALEGLELTSQQMKAIEILLKKSVPDLQSIEMTGDTDAPVVLKVITGVPPLAIENKAESQNVG
jgi:hypothetical protein